MSDRAIILRETIVSIVINTVVSIGFFLAVFGMARPTALADFGADFFPQAFMVALMGSLVPALILRARIGGPVRAVVLRAFAIAVVAAIVAGGTAFLLCRTNPDLLLAPRTALVIKALFGGLLSVLTTPIAVRAVLHSAPSRIVR